tara:strand:+ start:3304 stop:3783 length:480 start_codon:yes stop_codon:yes gene_type:complete
MDIKILGLPFFIFFISILILLIFQHMNKKNYIRNLFFSLFIGILFLIFLCVKDSEFKLIYSFLVYVSLFYLLANFFQQNKSGIQLSFLKKIYFSKNKRVKVNKLYNKNFEKEKFKKTLKKLYEMNIIIIKKRILVRNKFIYLFYYLVLIMRKFYNIDVR